MSQAKKAAPKKATNSKPPKEDAPKSANTSKWNNEEEQNDGDEVIDSLNDGHAHDSIKKSIAKYRFKK